MDEKQSITKQLSPVFTQKKQKNPAFKGTLFM